MRFIMFVCVADQAHVPAEDTVVPDVDDWANTLDASGVRIMGERLAGSSDARTVRVRGGETVITDGPFAETKEVIAGFDILECASLKEAIAVAAAHPMAYTHMIEVRSVVSGPF